MAFAFALQEHLDIIVGVEESAIFAFTFAFSFSPTFEGLAKDSSETSYGASGESSPLLLGTSVLVVDVLRSFSVVHAA